MAIQTICASLLAGLDASCAPGARKYYQQVVVINKADIDSESVVVSTTDYGVGSPVCKHNVAFDLLAGKTGYRISGPENGASIFGTYDKSRSDLGFPQYKHNVQILATGATEATKCVLDALDKGSYVIAAQLTDGTVEIYGIRNGITTGDYTYDTQGGGGGSVVMLSSLDDAPEDFRPLNYKSASMGGEGADFDDLFANAS